MKPIPPRRKRWFLGGVLAVVVLGAGYYGARHYAWPAFKAWRIARMNREARAFLTEGDMTNALLVARKSLQASNQNIEAWHIAATASTARQRPDAVWYQDSLCRLEPTKENYLELMRLALRFEVPDYALEAIKALEKRAQDNAEFHRLAAQVYLHTGHPVTAEFHLVALTHLQPDDLKAQLDLAEIELAVDPQRKNDALRARVLALAAHPEIRVRALTLLLQDNVARKATAGMEELVRQLQLTPGLGVAGRLLVIQALYLLGDPTASPQLAQLQVEVADKPQDAARVLEFLIRNGQPEQAQPWAATLPAATRKDEDVQHMVAEALLKLRDMPGLEVWLKAGTWPRHEYLRQALLARVYRSQGRSAEFASAWELALIDAGADLRKATALLARVDEWRWVKERHDVVWKLFALTPTNDSVQQILINWERHQGNTANLNRLFKRVVEVEPRDAVAINNLAYTDLLLDSNLEHATLTARKLNYFAPKNPYYATTYALALYKQGHPADALALLNGLTAVERTEPMRMLVRALCLAATGQAAPASDVLDGVVLRGLLPEERRLADTAAEQIARLDRAQGNRSRLLTMRRGQDQGADAAGWLALLPAEVRSSATTDMQLADSLYAAPDLDGLQELLRTTNWKDRNYLRYALLAFALRQRGDPLQAGEQWQQALALTNRNAAQLQNLRRLATKWQWTSEWLETLNLIFERTPGDHAVLEELLRYYRDARRTADLQRVLSLYVGRNTDPTDETVALAYYSLLLDVDVSQAHVMARNAFELTPADPARRMVYVFSLWKQHRSAEALPLIADMPADAKSDLVPIPLMRATIEAQMADVDAARANLGKFKADSALPEEAALATRISGQLASQRESVKPPQT